MSLSNDKSGDGRRKSDPSHDDPKPKSESRPAKARDAKGRDEGVGKTLRTVYQRAVDEAIPPEMLDLLGKLN